MVSVIIPYKEDRGFLKQCIYSIQAQTQNVEIIESVSHGSVGYNFNKGLEKANGEFVKYVCEDDFLPPTAIEDLVDGIGNSQWVCANAYLYKTWYNVPLKIERSVVKPLEDLLLNYTIHGGTTLYRTAILKEIGGMDVTLWTGEEYDMNLKLIFMGHIPAYIDKEVYYYRGWTHQKSRTFKRARPELRRAELEKIKARYDKRNSTV